VNTSSSGMFGGFGVTSYGAAKACIFGFSRNLAEDGRRVGINVNTLMPSAWTRLTACLDDETVLELLRERLQPDKVSAFLVWLVHPQTDIWNEVFRVSGPGASRVIVAATPSTYVDENTPEAWAARADALMADETLIPMKSTFDSFARELREADPDVDLSKSLAAGGNSMRPDKSDN
jgi:hypothetical protein